MTEKTILSRKELYKKVWTTPMIHLAKEFGISDRGLAKICQRYDIPRPGLGYWAKLEHGKKVPKVPLPSNSKLDKEKITINPLAKHIVNQWAKKRKVYIKYTIPITRSLSKINKLHPMVAKAVKNGFGKAGREGMYTLEKSCFSISANESNVPRSLMLIDTIIKAMEDRGHKLKVVTEERELYRDHKYTVKYCYFEIKGEQIRFHLRERFRQVAPKPDEKPYSNEWVYEPSGKLEFSIPCAYSCKYSWKDAEIKKLEDKLPLILKGILKAADSYKKKRVADKIRAEKEAEERRRAWENELQKRKERERIDDLMGQVNNWQKAKLIRRFLKSAEQAVIQKNGRYDKDSEFDQWLSWANNYAKSIDPLLP